MHCTLEYFRGIGRDLSDIIIYKSGLDRLARFAKEDSYYTN